MDRRPSTFSAGPDGSRGLLEAAQRLGLEVRRFRERSTGLDQLPRDSGQILVILDPSAPLSPPELSAVLRFGQRADLLVAGPGAGPLMRCFGYRVNFRFLEPVQVIRPGVGPGSDDPLVRRILVRTYEGKVVDSTRVADWGPFECQVPVIQQHHRLLVTPGGEVAAVQLELAGGGGQRHVILVADEDLFRNRTLRRSAAGRFVLSLIAGRYSQVVFEEYHHGFGPSGSLAGAALAWSRRSPWGWLGWQLAAVGVLALLFGAVRFGPARAGITRIRRSPLEHVRALAVALSAARGHDEAIGALVRGLRRRLVAPGTPIRSDWRGWLERLSSHAGTPGARDALVTLTTLTRPGQPASSVRLAANAVEDLWQELRP